MFLNPRTRQEPQKGWERNMAKGHYFTIGGDLFKFTGSEAKKVLKAVIQGSRGEGIAPEKMVAPVIDLDKISPEDATKAYMNIELGAGKE